MIVGIVEGSNWRAIRDGLHACGAATTSEPSPSQPDAVVVTLSDRVEVAAFTRCAKALPGVRYIEPDSFRTTM
jgi:hypothetical protein